MTKTLNLNPKKQTAVRRRPTKHTIAPPLRPPRATSAKKIVTAALLQEMTRRLVTEFDPEQVILFGSYAWGKPNQDSDVDLMVIVKESNQKEARRMVRALRALRGWDIPTDVFVKTRAEFDYFKQVYASLECLIAEKGLVLYDERRETRTRQVLVPQSEA